MKKVRGAEFSLGAEQARGVSWAPHAAPSPLLTSAPEGTGIRRGQQLAWRGRAAARDESTRPPEENTA